MLIFVTLLWSTILAGAEKAPVIYFGGWSSVDNFNWETNLTAPVTVPNNSYDKTNKTFIVPSFITGLSIICNASYPIEWNFHQELWGSHERWMVLLITRRTAKDIYNPSGFQYSAEVRFHGDSSAISGNYSCQKVGQPNVLSSIFIFWEGVSPPYLIFSRDTQTVYYNKESKVLTLPCRVSLPDVENGVSLFKDSTHNGTSVSMPILPGEKVKYSATVGFRLTDPKDPYGHYRCVVDNESDKDFVDINVVDGEDIHKMPFNEIISSPASFTYDGSKKQFVCRSSSDTPPKMMHIYCDHPVTCKLALFSLHTIESNSKRRVNGSYAYVKLRLTSAGVLRCFGDGIDIVREYFFPIGQGLFSRRRYFSIVSKNNDSINAQPFYSWKEAVPEKMLTITTRQQGVIYAGQNITFDCQVSPYYFSEGLKWAVAYLNGTNPNATHSFVIMNGSTFRYDRKRFQMFFRRNHGFLKITADVTIKSVVCIAPVWNTTEWKNTTLLLDIKVPIAPTVDGQSESVYFYVNETMKTLTCVAKGVPPPIIYWQKDNKTLRYDVMKTTTVNGTSTVNISRVSYETHGVYTCHAKNFAGKVTKVITVSVLEKTSSGTVIILCLSIFGLLIGAAAFALIAKKVMQQNKTIRHLTNVAFKDVDPQPGHSQDTSSQPQTFEVNPSTTNGLSKNINEITDDCDNPSNGSRYQRM